MRHAGLLAPALLALALAACSAGDDANGATAGSAETATAPAADAAPDAPATAEAAADTGTATAGATDPADFELDMARVDKWLEATRRLSALTQEDEALEDVVSADANEPRESYIARLEGHPAVAAAIRGAGLTPTEYALTTETLVGALFAIGMLEAGAIKELPPSIRDTQPVAFVQANKAEITAKMDALKRGDASAE